MLLVSKSISLEMIPFPDFFLNNLLCNNKIISNVSPKDKYTLVWSNEEVNVVFKPSSNKFGNSFIHRYTRL